MTLPRVLLLTDRSQLRLGRGLVRTVAECVEAGLTHVVLRELDLCPDRRAALAADLAATGAQVIAAHRPLPAAVGLHIPADASCNTWLHHPPARNRSVVAGVTTCYSGSGTAQPIVGRSCHSRIEVERAAAEGASYATLSPYAATDSKPGYGPPLPAGALAGLPLPVYALGGITPDNAAEALDAGADGVAVMGAVMRAPEPAAVVADLLAAVTPAVHRQQDIRAGSPTSDPAVDPGASR